MLETLLLTAAITLASALGISAQTSTPTITATVTCAGVTLAGETGGSVDGLAMVQAFVDETLGLDAQRVVSGTFTDVLVPWTNGPLAGTHSVRADVWLFVPYIGDDFVAVGPAPLVCSEPLHIQEYLAVPASDAETVDGGVKITLNFNSLANPADGGLVEVWETWEGDQTLTASFMREPGTAWTMTVNGADETSVFTAKLMGASGAWEWTVVPLTAELESLTAETRPSAIILEWTSVSELDILGYELYRSATLTGTRSLLVALPAAAPGSVASRTYNHRDVAVGKFYYWLGVVHLNTGLTTYGPVEAGRWLVHLPISRK